MVALSHCFGHVGQRCKALHDPRRQQRRGRRGAMSGAMSGPLSEIDIHKLNSGQKLNMIMCARFNLPSFTPSPYLLAPLLLLLFLIILFFIDFRKRQRNSQATYATSCCGPPATLKMKRFSLKIMLPYAIVCVCECVVVLYVCVCEQVQYFWSKRLCAQNWKPKS